MKILHLMSPIRPKEIEKGATKVFVRKNIVERPVDMAKSRVNYEYDEIQYTHVEYLMYMNDTDVDLNEHEQRQQQRLDELEIKCNELDKENDSINNGVIENVGGIKRLENALSWDVK